MNNILVKLIVSALAVFGASYVLPGVHVEAFLDALLVAIILAFLNAFLKPVLLILTFPLTVFTLGLFLFVLNAIIIMIADWMLDAIYVDTFWWALLFSLILSVFTSLLEGLFGIRKPVNKP